MKKLSAILLLGLFLFHWMGYQALYSFWLQQADEQLEARLDKADYNEAELETIVLPLHLPYLYNQATYERTDGEIILNGITYKYVQRRVWHDSLYLQCLPHHEAMRLKAAQNSSIQAANGLLQKETGFSKITPSVSKQFTNGNDLFSLRSMAVPTAASSLFIAYSQAIPFYLTATGPDQPPEV